MKEYELLVCGGTFDLLHKGHKAFLRKIFEHGEKVLIGLTSDSYLSTKNHQHEDYELRKNNLEAFLNDFAKGRFEITQIKDLYGPIVDSQFNEAVIAVSEETKEGAYKINEKRDLLDFPKLLILSISMEKAEDGGLISSTRIRNGEINREGKLYAQPVWLDKTLVLPEELREKLAKPFGKILDSVPDRIAGGKTICVGDVTVRKFNKKNISQFLSIVDFNVQRRKEFSSIEDLGFTQGFQKVGITNKHGTISPELFNAVVDAFRASEEKVIFVKGEEDLAVMPVVLVAPLGFKVYYGQPNQGLVEILVTEEIKAKVFDLVNKFDLE